MRVLLALGVAAVLAVAATGANAAGERARGTLYGVLTQGPTRPVCRVDEPCDGPAPGVTLTFRRDGSVLGRVVTGRAGGYRITLGPGVYAVRTSRKPFGTVPSPPTARVVVGRTRRVDFAIDTGIR